MKDLYFNNTKELELFLENKEKIGEGAEGTCFKIDDYALKIYKELLLDYKDEINADYLQFKNLDIPHFNFVKNSVYIENKYLVGTISKYVEGKVLNLDTLYYEPVEDLIEAIIKLLPSIKSISEKGIIVGDIFINNIIYKKGNLNFIDTASYQYTYEEPYYLYKYNVIEIMKELMMSITNSYCNMEIFKYLNKIGWKYNYNWNTELLLQPIQLIKGLRNSLEDYCDIKINSFSDCEQVLVKKLNC